MIIVNKYWLVNSSAVLLDGEESHDIVKSISKKTIAYFFSLWALHGVLPEWLNKVTSKQTQF